MQYLESGNVAVVFLLVFLVLMLATIVFYFAVAGCGYFVFFVWSKDRFFPSRTVNCGQNAEAIRLSLISIVVMAFLTAPIDVLVIRGWSRVYWSVDDYGWGYLLFSVVALLVFTETVEYWLHRALHHRFLYRSLHSYHHDFRDPNPWVSLAFHPLDSFSQGLPYFLFAFLLPIHIGVYHLAVVAVMVWNVMIHDQLTFFPWNFLNHTAHHTLHHSANKYNYGQYFTLWDRLCGTYRSPNVQPSDSRAKRQPAIAASALPSTR